MTRVVPSEQLLRHLSRLCAQQPAPAICASARHLSTSKQPAPHKDSQTAFSARHRPRAYSTTTEPPTATQTPKIDVSTHYSLFPSTIPSGPPPASPFTVPLPTLRREFLRLQALHHPDKSPPGNPRHKTSVALSSLLNTAYRTLSDPLLRAQYLLNLKYEIDVTSEDNGAHPADQATLMEVIEAQEAIEEARSQEDIDKLIEENKIRIEETIERMGAAFEADDAETAKKECVRLKYWRSLQEGLGDWEMGKEVRLIH